MEAVSTSPFQHLNWNEDKKYFKILDSTDRKILSFLWSSILPTCTLYKGTALSDYPLLKKEFNSFKPLFLDNLTFIFKKHIDSCPVEEYKQEIQSLYEDLKQQIGDLKIDDTVSNEMAFNTLEKIMTDCVRKLFDKSPLKMSSVPFCDIQEENKEYLEAFNKGQCYHYAFYLTKEYKVMKSLIPFESSCSAAFLLYPKYFIQQLGYDETDNPAKGDLVLYLGDPKLHNNNNRFKHLGMITEKGTVKSYWLGLPCQFEHQVSQVPDMYGFDVIFFHKKTLQDSPNFEKILKTTNKISTLVLQFYDQYIPSPLSTQGALFFLFDKLKNKFAEVSSSSEPLDWSKIQVDLIKDLSLHSKRSAVLEEFKAWLKESFPNYLD